MRGAKERKAAELKASARARRGKKHGGFKKSIVNPTLRSLSGGATGQGGDEKKTEMQEIKENYDTVGREEGGNSFIRF